MGTNEVMKTKRLIIKPMDDAALEALLRAQTDKELIKAYGEMLSGSRQHPGARLWYTAWSIVLPGGKPVGDICFKGPQKQGTVEWGYGLEQPYQGMGYMTEAARMLLDWAFSQPEVYAVEAETRADNAASQRVLEKL